MYKKIKGILFDFDGVIAESEQIWFGTALVTLKKMGMKYDRSIKQKSTIGIISEHLFQKLILEEDYNLTQVMRNYKKELKRAFDQQSPKIYPHLKYLWFEILGLKFLSQQTQSFQLRSSD